MMIYSNQALEERGICARIPDHQRQRSRPDDRRLHRVLRRRARAQGHHRLYRGDLGYREIQGRLPHGARRRQVDCRDQARPVGSRPQRRAGAYRLARRQHRGVRRGRGRSRRHPRRHARRRGRDHRAARPYRRADRPPARRRDAVGRLSRHAARRRRTQRPGIPPARSRDHRTAQCRAHGRLAGEQPDRRRLRRAEQRRQLHGLDRRAARRSERRHGAGPGGAAARARRRPQREIHPAGERIRRHQGHQADRVHHADHARPDRLQPRLRAKAPHISFLQEAYKGLRAIASVARRAERERLASAPVAEATAASPMQRTIVERVRSRARPSPIALDEAESKNVLRAYGIATPTETLVTRRPPPSRPPTASAIRSCSRRCRPRCCTSRTWARSRSTSRRPKNSRPPTTGCRAS